MIFEIIPIFKIMIVTGITRNTYSSIISVKDLTLMLDHYGPDNIQELH
jgi:hypothetical protein